MKKKCIFIKSYKHVIVDIDEQILKKHFRVIPVFCQSKKGVLFVISLLKQGCIVLKNIRKSELIIVEFGSYFSLFPIIIGKLFGIQTAIIVHGTECALLPSYNYGSLRIKSLYIFLKYSYLFVDKILPVSESLVHSKNTFGRNPSEYNQGLLSFFKLPKSKFFVVPNSIYDFHWETKNKIRRNKICCSVLSNDQFYLKGGDLIIEFANNNPDYTINLIGIDKVPSSITVPSNVKLLGKINQTELRNCFLKSGKYFQLSAFEGFGMALCEAIASGLIPIVSDVNILPQLVKDPKLIVRNKKLYDLNDVVKYADKLSQADVDDIYNYINDITKMTSRESRLLKALS